MSITGVKWRDVLEGGVVIADDQGNIASVGLKVASDLSTIGDGPTRRDVLKWIADGGVVSAADPAPTPPTTREQIIAELQASPLKRAQARETRDRLALTNDQMLDLLVAKADGS